MSEITIVKLQTGPDSVSCLGYPLVGFQVYVLVLHAAPETLYEYIVHPSTLDVHADRLTRVLEHACKGRWYTGRPGRY